MRIGLYTVALQHLPLDDLLDSMASWDITDAEIAAGGFVHAAHCPTEQLLRSRQLRQNWLGRFQDRGMRISALNVNGNPLHPDPRVREAHARDTERALRLAPLVGVDRIVVMPGAPGGDPRASRSGWYPAPWETGLLDARDYQWSVAVPYWRSMAELAAENGVRICIEAHPHTVVYNIDTLERLLDAVGADNLGVNLDPSHLFWQGIDPIRAVERLGGRIWNAAAKDTLIDADAVAVHGLLDDRFTRVTDNPYELGGGYSVTRPPEDAPWRFAAAGRGHDVDWWSKFVTALAKSGFDDVVAIENEDWDLTPDEAIPFAASTLRAAIDSAGLTEPDNETQSQYWIAPTPHWSTPHS
jgi:sugar phosphate isomerase/epimerase